LTPRRRCATIRANICPSLGNSGLATGLAAKAPRPLRENDMQFLPGFTVQCINPQCEARGHWLRADVMRPFGLEGLCPCCGDSLRNVPPPLGPRFRMRPRPLTARPPLRPRPR
jgi:hypothetical protein